MMKTEDVKRLAVAIIEAAMAFLRSMWR